MPTLLAMLSQTDTGMMHAIAEVWGVSLKTVSQAEAPQALARAMQEPARAEAIWDTLSDKARGALQTLRSQEKAQMPQALFERLFGEIRKRGAGQIEKEKPHKNPVNVSEELLYRGWVGLANVNDEKLRRIISVVFIPEDVLAVWPFHKTSYDQLADDDSYADLPDDDEDGEGAGIVIVPDAAVRHAQAADTSIVDDMTTLLAYLRLHSAAVEGDTFLPPEAERILPYLLKPDLGRLTFMLCVGISAELIDVREGRAYPRRDGLQKWFALPRWGQVRHLADAWRNGTIYQEIWHVPGLYPENVTYDAVISRLAVLDFLAKLPPARAWWSLQSFIDVIKESDPDFQRPNGDYDTWYIRTERGDYLRGFESWDAVEGALIAFLMQGPLHWLGLMDTAEDVVRLNAYGRAFVGLEPFPQQPDPEERVIVREDGTLIASRRVPRGDRFTLARFSAWVRNAEPFTYRLEPRSIERAVREQGITTAQIEAFLKKQVDPRPIPTPVLRLLTLAQAPAAAEVTFEQVIVLRTLSPEILDRLLDEPAFRRYLGARLGPMAAVVLADTAEELRQKLEQNGLRVDLMGMAR